MGIATSINKNVYMKVYTYTENECILLLINRNDEGKDSIFFYDRGTVFI